MKHLIWFIVLLGSTIAVKAQNLEPLQQLIKKKKYRYCSTQRTYTDSESQEQSAPHKHGEWSFNEQGQVLLYEKFNNQGETAFKGQNSYNKNGHIILTVEDNTRINEHEEVAYTYNDKGLLEKKTDHRDQKLVVTYLHYYGDDLLRDSTIWLDKNDKPELVEYYTYNEKGWLTEQREQTDYGRADGRTIYEYHDDGTLKDEILYDGFDNIFERMYYNEAGFITRREISYIDYQVIYEYAYNKKGLLESYTRKQSNLPQYETIIFSWSKKKP